MTLLRIEDLTVTGPGGQRLVDGASWTLEAGGRLGIIGESGSGKSLTALAVLGLLPEGLRAGGSIILDGTELVGAPERRLRPIRGRRIAMVFQEPLTALDPLMTVGRQLAGPLRLHQGLRGGAVRTAAAALCERVRLPEIDRVLESYPWQLSGGQRQRVGIAIALACRPDVLIADEPTTALDVTVQAQILDLLDDLVRDTGTALIFVSHDLPVVARLTEDLVVMRRGQVVERTTLRRALTTTAHPYTAELIDAARELTGLPGAGR